MRGITKRTTKGGETRWDAVWDEPTADGTRKQRKKTFRTRKEAERFRTKSLHEIHSGTYIQPSTTTVAEHLETWLDVTASTVRHSTFTVYAAIVRTHLIPALGGIKLANLEPKTIQRLYRRFLDAGAAPSTVRLRHNVLHKALDQAVAWQEVNRNAADGAKPPAVNQPEVAVWSAEEVHAFFAATAADPRHALWRFGFDTGMRIGEMLALSWGDVNLEAGTVVVRRNLVPSAKGGWEIEDRTKTKAGRRSIALLPATVAALPGAPGGPERAAPPARAGRGATSGWCSPETTATTSATAPSRRPSPARSSGPGCRR